MSVIIESISHFCSLQIEILSLTRESSFTTLARLLFSSDLHSVLHWPVRVLMTSLWEMQANTSLVMFSRPHTSRMLSLKTQFKDIKRVAMYEIVSHLACIVERANFVNLATNICFSHRLSVRHLTKAQ